MPKNEFYQFILDAMKKYTYLDFLWFTLSLPIADTYEAWRILRSELDKTDRLKGLLTPVWRECP